MKTTQKQDFICINNTLLVYRDGSTDKADELLTLGKKYTGFYNKEGDSIFILSTNFGPFPTGHRWFKSSRFKPIIELREDKLNELL